MEPWSSVLDRARVSGELGRFWEVRALCADLVGAHSSNLLAHLDACDLLLSCGLLTDALDLIHPAATLAPNDLRPFIIQANIASQRAEHSTARHIYDRLALALPDNQIVGRNALINLEYDGTVPDIERAAAAEAWGERAVRWAQGPYARPSTKTFAGRPLKVGYVSADICQHTVGLFVKDVIAAHDPSKVVPFVYNAGGVSDWVTNEVKLASSFRDVQKLDDGALADLIRADAIDVLVDLSGHTAGSRLTAFAYRPAPVMVSWLGYFATTGLPCMDAVLLDEWHAPPEVDALFTETVIRMPQGRLCYTPVPFAPDVAPAPHERTGVITFGSFNNTAKLNDDVLALWALILRAAPDSRLVLKWRTFNDDALRAKTLSIFEGHGVDPTRIELRGPSFHADLLKEYEDIDIALDPFPFTGGLTSCEALWMGVPVVTWPQSRVVSRQTAAFLHQIGLPELVAESADDYIRIAVELAGDPEQIMHLRRTLRQRMKASPLCDVEGFTRNLETSLIDLYQRIEADTGGNQVIPKTVLHVGPGHRDNGAKLPAGLQGADWREVRLDIDPATEPDIVGSMLDMGAVDDVSVDAIYSAHNLEHVYAHEVPLVLKEFLRVLKPDGFLVATCPDLQAVCQMVAEDKLGDAAYTSQAGPITPLDILYGHGAAVASGHHYMAHKTGYTLKTLTQALHAAGFVVSAGKRRTSGLDLWVVACKGVMEEAALRELAAKMLPA